jgi:hypothetical protein
MVLPSVNQINKDFQTMKVSMSMMLAVMVAAVSVVPAIASAAVEPESNPLLISQVTSVTELSGEVTSVSGETVEVRQTNGQVRQITLPQQDIDRLNLRRGSRVILAVDQQNIVTTIRLAPRALW